MTLTDQEIEAFVRMKYKDVPEGKYYHVSEPNRLSKQGMMAKDVEEMKFLRDGSKPKLVFEEDKPNHTC